LIDEIAERYLDLVDDLDDEIDELEDRSRRTPRQDARPDRRAPPRPPPHPRTLAPMRDAVRRVIDNTVEVRTGRKVFPTTSRSRFNAAYDKFLRASDGLDLARDLSQAYATTARRRSRTTRTRS
jgi:Mg2+ and Co2+ transporter CorA